MANEGQVVLHDRGGYWMVGLNGAVYAFHATYFGPH